MLPTPSHRLFTVAIAAGPVTASAPTGIAAQRAMIPIVIETELGNIEAELDSARAPITVANFLRYVDAHMFDDARFFRAVRK